MLRAVEMCAVVVVASECVCLSPLGEEGVT